MGQLVEHPAPKLIGWVRFPSESCRRREKRYLRPVQPRARRWWVGGCKGWWPATSAAFTAKVATWTTAQVSGHGRRRPLATFRKECRRNRMQAKLKWN